MMTPQLTEQYGHVDRVSFARAIFKARSCANAGCKSNPKTAAAAPPTAPIFRKSRREACITPPLFDRKGILRGTAEIILLRAKIKKNLYNKAVWSLIVTPGTPFPVLGFVGHAPGRYSPFSKLAVQALLCHAIRAGDTCAGTTRSRLRTNLPATAVSPQFRSDLVFRA